MFNWRQFPIHGKSNVLGAISHVKFLPSNSYGYQVHAKEITTHRLIENIVITPNNMILMYT